MSEVNVFEMASRMKFRFPYKGQIAVEDLWDLSVESLDSIFKTLKSQVKKNEEESLLRTKSKEGEILDAQIEIVKHIVSVKLDEADKRAKAREKRQRDQRIMEIIADKKDAALKEKSVEELEKMLEDGE